MVIFSHISYDTCGSRQFPRITFIIVTLHYPPKTALMQTTSVWSPYYGVIWPLNGSQPL